MKKTYLMILQWQGNYISFFKNATQTLSISESSFIVDSSSSITDSVSKAIDT